MSRNTWIKRRIIRHRQTLFQYITPMKKQDIVATLRRALQAVTAHRQSARSNATTRAAIGAVKRFQSQRMAATHGDLLAAPATHKAAQFFLDDLYGDTDLTQRDADIERIVPMMERLLPTAALQTIAEAIELDALSEMLDGAMAACLGATFSEQDYCAAYRDVTARTDRERQLAHVRSVGGSLCELVRFPLIGSTLLMMRGPARIAHLSELHSFLERGFAAFKGMKRPADFVATILAREAAILENLYAGRTQPCPLAIPPEL
jgi:hypothetical protein